MPLQDFSSKESVWLFVRDPKKLDKMKREYLAALCQASITLKRAYDLVQDFFSMVRKREGARVDVWLAQATESEIAELQSFAAGIEKDKDAVRAGLTWPINNGMVEGHVTKLPSTHIMRLMWITVLQARGVLTWRDILIRRSNSQAESETTPVPEARGSLAGAGLPQAAHRAR